MSRRDRSWYQANGVADPSSDVHGSEQDIQQAMSAKVRHEWRQKGPVLFCVACPWEHATEPVFGDYILEGTADNGAPILRKVIAD